MAETEGTPAVALLFADADLGAHLREALSDLGARIVHEGPATEVHPRTLADSGADVVVVNLEAAEEDHIEQLYDALSEGPFRVVFNDAEASRELSGWDRARWARHLAVKLLGYGDVDPPRPEGARAVEIPPEAPAAEARLPGESGNDAAGEAIESSAAADAAGGEALSEARDTLRAQSLETELEALLAEGAQDGDVGESEPEVDAAEDEPDPPSSAQVEARQTVATPAPASEWELVDFDAAPPLPPPVPDASQFGIEKVAAVDYLSPEGGDAESELQPGLSLELVSLEESVAPAMVDETEAAAATPVGGFGMISRVAVLCVGSDETPEAGRFLAGLPDTLALPLLVVQHQEQQGAEELAGALGTMTRLSVQVASDGARVGPEQVWLAPAGQQCRLARDGCLELSAGGESALGDPSMDQCLLALAEVFGANVTMIVLAGAGRDGLAGAHGVRDRGGQVWVQDPATCGEDSMAGVIHAEGLATFTGTPAELAAHLHEECP